MDDETENSERKLEDGARRAAGQLGVHEARKGLSRAHDAGRVADTIKHIRKAPPPGVSQSQWLQEAAEATAKSTGLTGKSGARGQLIGHLIEEMDVSSYNKRNLLTGRRLVPRIKARNEAYDASRIVKRKFAGGVQQKASAAGVESAVSKIERLKPGSAKRATLRVPRDELARASKRAGKRIKVRPMDFTRAEANKVADRGLADLSAKGKGATSKVRGVAKGGAISAALTAGLGAVSEFGAPSPRRDQRPTFR